MARDFDTNKRSIQAVGCFVLIIYLASTAHAGLLVQYDLENSYDKDPEAANVIATNLTQGSTIAGDGTFSTFSPFSGSYSLLHRGSVTGALGTPANSSSQFLQYWLEFTIEPASGYKLNLDSVTWQAAGRNLSGTSGFKVRNTLYWDEDTYLNDIGFHEVDVPTSTLTNYSQGTSTFTSSSFTTPVTFRLTIESDTTGDDQINYLDFIQVNGSAQVDGGASAVPEPSTFFMVGIAGLGFACCRKRFGIRFL